MRATLGVHAVGREMRRQWVAEVEAAVGVDKPLRVVPHHLQAALVAHEHLGDQLRALVGAHLQGLQLRTTPTVNSNCDLVLDLVLLQL